MSDEEAEKEEKYKNIRGAAARNHKAKKERERGDAERVEASNKRKSAGEKRGGDGKTAVSCGPYLREY